jgi:thioredoxin 1
MTFIYITLFLLISMNAHALFHGLPMKTISPTHSITSADDVSTGIPSYNDITLPTQLSAASGLSVVLFTSDWCGPCKTQKAVIEQLMGKFESCNFCSLDTDNNHESVDKYNIRSIPTTAFFQNGKIVGEIVGAVPRSVIAHELTKYLAL